ncbi:hypothetical protein K0M31_012461 [Melipona bicolor]|uniref:Uncharacterized protein n=1 Tax=Melipona bicolor TaxID=60889 RepID=A0AA40FJX9_9HYME|nr:hypothetical protein K0M31_012461 [Melipona bicolor]
MSVETRLSVLSLCSRITMVRRISCDRVIHTCFDRRPTFVFIRPGLFFSFSPYDKENEEEADSEIHEKRKPEPKLDRDRSLPITSVITIYYVDRDGEFSGSLKFVQFREFLLNDINGLVSRDSSTNRGKELRANIDGK